MPLCVFGDFNVNFDPLVTDPHAREICTVMDSFGLVSCMNEHSRVQDDTMALIDNVFFNYKSLFQNSMTVHNHLSDHGFQQVFFTFGLPFPGKPSFS